MKTVSSRLGDRIAHNLIIDCFRQEKQENLVSCDEEERNLLNNIRLSEGTVEAEIVNHQILSDVRRLMKHLPDEQREVVHMRFYQDLSFKEIAEMTGVSINTSLGRMRYAILNLRRMAEEAWNRADDGLNDTSFNKIFLFQMQYFTNKAI